MNGTNRTTPPPLVERVIEGEEFHVDLVWHAEAVLPALLEALGSSAYLLGQVARWRCTNSPEGRDEALAAIANTPAVREALTFHLSQEAADAHAGAMNINAALPETCNRSGCFDLTDNGTGWCDGHVDAEPILSRAV